MTWFGTVDTGHFIQQYYVLGMTFHIITTKRYCMGVDEYKENHVSRV